MILKRDSEPCVLAHAVSPALGRLRQENYQDFKANRDLEGEVSIPDPLPPPPKKKSLKRWVEFNRRRSEIWGWEEHVSRRKSLSKGQRKKEQL